MGDNTSPLEKEITERIFKLKFRVLFFSLKFLLYLSIRYTRIIPDQNLISLNSITKIQKFLKKCGISPRIAVIYNLCMCLCSAEDPLQFGVQSAARPSRRLHARGARSRPHEG